MALLCSCGEELVVNVSNGKQSTYCQNCGREDESPAQSMPRGNGQIIPITRAAILKKLHSPQPESKKPKQIKQQRDRKDYTARRMR